MVRGRKIPFFLQWSATRNSLENPDPYAPPYANVKIPLYIRAARYISREIDVWGFFVLPIFNVMQCLQIQTKKPKIIDGYGTWKRWLVIKYSLYLKILSKNEESIE